MIHYNYTRKAFNKLFCLTTLFLSFNCFSEEEPSNNTIKQTTIEKTVLGMNVSGNKEAPNSLYIIPWKDSTEHSKPPEINRLMDEVFSTVDPDVYEKELGFYQKLTKANSESIKKD
ncbi:MAG: hypothetical protein ACJAS9_000107 [Polaribacter sp.]|jgi:hypothetical protein